MTAKQLDTTLAALADPTRRRVVDLLRDGPQRAGELAARTHTSAPSMSRHLRVLRTSGLVTAELSDDDARARVYRLRAERLRAVHEWLDSFWAGQLGAFKAHAERKR